MSLPILVIEHIEPYFSKELIYYQSIADSGVPQRACFVKFDCIQKFQILGVAGERERKISVLIMQWC